MTEYTLGIPLGETVSYGKANLAKLPTYRLYTGGITSAQALEYVRIHYMVAGAFATSVYGIAGDIYETSVSAAAATASALMTAAEYKMDKNLQALADDTTDMMSTDVAMTLILQFEKALQTATNVRSRFTKEFNTRLALNASSSNAYSSSNRQVFLNKTMQSIYNNYYNDGTDISMYELKDVGTTTPFATFSDLSVLFTTRLGSLDYDKVSTLTDMISQDSVIRNNHSIAYYGSEFTTEMIQNSLLQSFQTTNKSGSDYVSPSELSCGFFIIHDPTTKEVKNIRMYCSYVFTPDVGTSTGATYPVAISSGVDLFDNVDIAKYKIGASSANFITLLNNICLTLNGDAMVGFTTSNTTWEFGPNNIFNTLFD